MHTIMLVDDDAVLLRCLTELLEKCGYQAIGHPNAETALAEIAAGTQVDLVITDYRLTGMDGVEFLHALRHLRPELPAVLLTAHGTLDGYLKAKGLGGVEFIPKPVKATELKRTIEASL